MPEPTLRKTTWSEVADEVKEVNLQLYKIIEAIDPSPKYHLYVGEYPYGCEFLKQGKYQVPTPKYGLLPLSDGRIPSQIRNDLSYNIGTNPVSLVLQNCIEVFLDKPTTENPITFFIASEGNIFSINRVLNNQHHQPAYLWNISSGTRSAFMLPKISQAKKYKRLRSALNIDINIPNGIEDHWDVFKKIANTSKTPWSSKLLVFSQSWFNNFEDKNWNNFKTYLWEATGQTHCLKENYFIWDIVLSSILRELNIRPDLYINNTIKYLLQIASSSFPGICPYIDDKAMPCSYIQQVFTDVYNINGYLPTIMGPAYFDLFDRKSIVYYSLQNPNLFETPKKRDNDSLLSSLYDILSLLNKYKEKILDEKLNLNNTILFDFMKNASISGYHPNPNKYRIINPIKDLLNADQRFQHSSTTNSTLKVATHSSFFNGCIKFQSAKYK